MNQDLQKLIDIAKDGDAITPKQREIILKKAQELGEDLDEVEMVLESIQSKHIAKESTKKNEERRKCPNCGAIINDSALVCPECGYVLQQENKASSDARALIDKLQEKLTAATNSTSTISSFLGRDEERQASIVNTFSMPTTKEGLIVFLEFAYSNYIGVRNSLTLQKAWYGKTMQAYNSLARLGSTDPETMALLEKYSSLISKEKKKHLKEWLYPIAALLVFAVVIPILGIRSDNSASEEVGECLSNNDFAGARAAAHKYSGDETKLLDEISVQEVSFLIEEHNYGQARIVASGIEDKEKKESVLTSIENAEKRSLDNN